MLRPTFGRRAMSGDAAEAAIEMAKWTKYSYGAIAFCGVLSAVAVARRARSFIMVQKICVAATAWARRRRERGVRRNSMVLPRLRRAAAESAGKSGSAAAP